MLNKSQIPTVRNTSHCVDIHWILLIKNTNRANFSFHTRRQLTLRSCSDKTLGSIHDIHDYYSCTFKLVK